VYVVGEVRDPGRYELVAPTSVMQAVTTAGGWNVGAKLDDVVVIRRDENWRLTATRLQLHDAFFGRQPCPPHDVWLRDGDLVVVPKTHIQWTGDLIQQYFSRAIYGLLPTSGSVNLGGSGI
jgi:polysaccharide export outer membrane protein